VKFRDGGVGGVSIYARDFMIVKTWQYLSHKSDPSPRVYSGSSIPYREWPIVNLLSKLIEPIEFGQSQSNPKPA